MQETWNLKRHSKQRELHQGNIPWIDPGGQKTGNELMKCYCGGIIDECADGFCSCRVIAGPLGLLGINPVPFATQWYLLVLHPELSRKQLH